MIAQLVFLEALTNAVDMVRRTGGRALDNLTFALEGDSLELEVVIHDGATYGEFFDVSVNPCWDGCNNITNYHRSGWCKVNQSHADMDCMCGISLEDEAEFYAYLDEQAALERGEPMFEVVGALVVDVSDEEPF